MRRTNGFTLIYSHVPANNHVADDVTVSVGENIVFADGHGEWVANPARLKQRYKTIYW